jgi:hypothetical protein
VCTVACKKLNLAQEFIVRSAQTRNLIKCRNNSLRSQKNEMRESSREIAGEIFKGSEVLKVSRVND